MQTIYPSSMHGCFLTFSHAGHSLSVACSLASSLVVTKRLLQTQQPPCQIPLLETLTRPIETPR